VGGQSAILILFIDQEGEYAVAQKEEEAAVETALFKQ
jgi:hypothetical protein